MQKCALCSVNDAVMLVKQVVDGHVQELSICKACAEKQGLKSPLSIADFLFGAGPSAGTGGGSVKKPASCPACHMTWSDFKKSERLGCPSCYEAFAEQLLPMIEDMHRATEHTGRRPAREAREAEIVSLRRLLQQAVARQDFEEAAGIRDRILALEQQIPEMIR